MQAAQIIPFCFEAREVRTLLIDDQPWFVAADVASALQYLAAKDMARNLDDDEKGRQIVPTLGGDQEMLVINESGLYSAILRSRKAEAKRFKKWVTAEVLPAIRKHGRYEDADNRLTTLVGQTIGTDGFHMLGALIKGKVSSLPVPVQRRATAKIWSQTHAAFGVRSAADIPAEQLDAARNFIAAYALEGEWIQKPKERGLTLSPGEADALYGLMSHLYFAMRGAGDLSLFAVSNALGSRILMSVAEHLREASIDFKRLDKRRDEIYAAYLANSSGRPGGYAMSA